MLWEGDCACGGRAVSNGMEKMTRSLWRLDIVQRRTPFVVSDRCTIPDMNLHCGANRLYAVNAVCRVACLAWAGREREADAPSAHGLEHRRYSLERRSAKEDKSRKKLWWKSPRLSKGQIWDCGTDSVAIGYRHRQRAGPGMKGKPPLRRREAARVENKPDLSRKINQICCHQKDY